MKQTMWKTFDNMLQDDDESEKDDTKSEQSETSKVRSIVCRDLKS